MLFMKPKWKDLSIDGRWFCQDAALAETNFVFSGGPGGTLGHGTFISIEMMHNSVPLKFITQPEQKGRLALRDLGPQPRLPKGPDGAPNVEAESVA